MVERLNGTVLLFSGGFRISKDILLEQFAPESGGFLKHMLLQELQ